MTCTYVSREGDLSHCRVQVDYVGRSVLGMEMGTDTLETKRTCCMFSFQEINTTAGGAMCYLHERCLPRSRHPQTDYARGPGGGRGDSRYPGSAHALSKIFWSLHVHCFSHRPDSTLCWLKQDKHFAFGLRATIRFQRG